MNCFPAADRRTVGAAVAGGQAKTTPKRSRGHAAPSAAAAVAGASSTSRGSDTSSAYSGSGELDFGSLRVVDDCAEASPVVATGSCVYDEDSGDDCDDLPMVDDDVEDCDEEAPARADDLSSPPPPPPPSLQSPPPPPPPPLAALRKPPGQRSPEDVAALAEAFGRMRAFADFTRAALKRFAEVALRYAATAAAATVATPTHAATAAAPSVLADGQGLDAWFVVVSGEVEVARPGGQPPERLSCGDAFGARPQAVMDREQLPPALPQSAPQRQVGTVRAVTPNCEFARVPLDQYLQVLAAEANRTVELRAPDGSLALVKEVRPAAVSAPTPQLQVVTRGTPEALLEQLLDPRCELSDPGYTDDFLLTHRIFFDSSVTVARRLLEAASAAADQPHRARAVRVLLTWAGGHFADFEANTELFGVLLRLDEYLRDREDSQGERQLLRLACSTGSASCRAAPPPSAFTTGRDPGVRSLRVHRPDGGGHRVLALPSDATVGQAADLARRAFCLPSASPAGDYRLLEVSAADPGPLVRRRALPPDRSVLSVSGRFLRPGVRFYLAGPLEPADRCLATDAEARELAAEATAANGTIAVVEEDSATASDLAMAAGCMASDCGVLEFLTADAQEIARRLTDADRALYRRIRPDHLVDWWAAAPAATGGPVRGPMRELMAVTEAESAWPLSVLTLEMTSPQRRLRALKQLLRVCQHCRQLGNINSLMSLTLGLAGARTNYHLASTWDRLPKKYRALWLLLERLTDVSMNHAGYRQLLRSVGRDRRMPYLAILCKDLAALRECGHWARDGLVNFERLRVLAREVRNFCQYSGSGNEQSPSQHPSEHHHHLSAASSRDRDDRRIAEYVDRIRRTGCANRDVL